MRRQIGLSVAAALGLAAAVPAWGGVILNETFAGATKTDWNPTPSDLYKITGVYNWFAYSPAGATVNIETTVGNTQPSLRFDDSGTAGGRLELNFGGLGAFDMATPGQEVVKFGADLRVDSYTGAGASQFRLALQDGGRTNPYFIAGLSHGTIGGVDKLFLFAGDTASANNYFTPGAADAIGWDGSNWAAGFDFGTYQSGVAAANDTNDEFYRLEVTFKPSATPGQQDVVILATQLSTGNTASLTKTLTTPFMFSNTQYDFVKVLGPGSGQGTGYVDNITIESSPIPEPAAGLIGLGTMGLLALRRAR